MFQDQENIKNALEAFGDQAPMLIELTLKDANRFVEDIQTAINDNNTEDAGLAAHSLKSIMRQLGAEQVGDVAFEIEKAAKESDLETCKSSATQLDAIYTETKSFLEDL